MQIGHQFMMLDLETLSLDHIAATPEIGAVIASTEGILGRFIKRLNY